MFSFLRPRNYEHYVDHGCVHCPRSGFDVEVDACTGCEWLTAIDLQAKPPYVRCRAVSSAAQQMRMWT